MPPRRRFAVRKRRDLGKELSDDEHPILRWCSAMSFQLVGVPYETFAPLFSLSDEALAKLDARRVIATEAPGYPCRVSLVDAAVGEELILVPFAHQPASSPYRASGPVFVRKAARPCKLDAGVMGLFQTMCACVKCPSAPMTYQTSWSTQPCAKVRIPQRSFWGCSSRRRSRISTCTMQNEGVSHAESIERNDA